MYRILLFSQILLFLLTGCESSEKSEATTNQVFKSSVEDPWPEIRKKRIKLLLPSALQAANANAWMVICRENNNDPVADHIGGENAGGTAAFLFYNDDKGFHSLVFSPEGEATALDELDIHDKVVPVQRGASAVQQAVDFITENSLFKLAVNSSENNSLADGLSFTQRMELERLTAGTNVELISSENVIYEWLSIKLPEEVEIMKQAAKLTAEWQKEAYGQIKPGKTTDADVARFLKMKMAEHGVTDGWSPDQNPNVNSGPDRGHSHATEKVIMPGDVIQTDFGIKVFGQWVSDIQRFAYVLKEGETSAPENIQTYWENAKKGNRTAFSAMKPGVKGIEVDQAQRTQMEKAGSEPVMWSTGHPVGYVAHDIGPNLGGSRATHVRPDSEKILKPGMVFAFDGFHAWKLPDGKTKTISVEEMAVITKEAAEYLISPQEELILVPSN